MKQLKFLLKLIIILAVLMGAGCLLFYFRMYVGDRLQETVVLPVEANPTSKERIIIFSPHCDDETLGTGGLISRAARTGAVIRIVEMTNGDGFHTAASREFGRINISPDDYMHLAYIRQNETVEALKVLGLNKPYIIFLGYPDKGLAPMWLENWDSNNLYTSRFTGRMHSPYLNSFTRNTAYCGANVLSDVLSIIKDFKPTDIYIPHPNDEHTDHWATNCYVSDAIKVLQESGELKMIKIHTYLAHRGEWPIPMGYNDKLKLSPPYLLSNMGTKWCMLVLDKNDVAKKYNAVIKFESQTAIMKRYMLSFVRKNELYGYIPSEKSFGLHNKSITVDGNPDDWGEALPVVEDPVKDNIRRDLNGCADIKTIYVADDKDHIYMRVDYRNRISERAKYSFFIHSLTDSNPAGQKYLNIKITPHKEVTGNLSNFAWKDRTMEIKVEKRELNNPRDIIIGTSTSIGRMNIDKAAFQLVSLHHTS